MFTVPLALQELLFHSLLVSGEQPSACTTASMYSKAWFCFDAQAWRQLGCSESSYQQAPGRDATIQCSFANSAAAIVDYSDC